ncbi:MAG: pyrroloquinoline quinone biosynthesis peptide chaperone PqqD [Gammaproteobacteria bacterium]|nr:pyrroloquinoline quinone biosynthesis peptide chaperone PqqD [Gammaproteobacteria bacterium]
MPQQVDTAARPAIGRGFRLQWEPAQEAHVLLYPEGMVRLNQSAAAILTRCDGARTVAGIVADLERTYAVSGLAPDVCAFVALAVDRTWVELLP